MKTIILLAAVVLLAGTASCNPVQDKAAKSLPDGWLPDKVLELVNRIREFIQNIDSENLSVEEIREKLWELAVQIRELLQGIEKPEWIEAIEWEQIKEQIIEVVDRIREFIESIDFENLTLEQIKEVLFRIREIVQGIFEGIDFPELPTLPEVNTPVPGQQSSIQQYPSVAQIEIGYGPVWVQAGTGAIITNFHFVVPARLFSGPLFGLEFRRGRVGSAQRYDDGVVYEFGSYVVHPDFNDGSSLFSNDIALARLNTPLSFTPSIQSVQIVVPDFELPSGLPLTLTGYGRTAAGVLRPASGDLHAINLVGIDRQVCAAKWASLSIFGDRTVVGSNNFCAGRPETGGRNVDVRDAGAPIYSNNVLVGIMSWGNFFGNQEYALVATSISPFTNWIVANAV